MITTRSNKPDRANNTHSDDMLQAYSVAIEKGLKQLSSLPDVSPGDINRCHTLHLDILDWTYSKLIHTETPSGLIQPARWDWHPMMDTSQLRIGFLTLHENKSVPIHDHPGSSGLLVVLQGRLQVQQFRRSDSNTSTRRMIDLTQLQEHEVGPGEFAIISPSEGNIHSLRACEGPCIVLDLLLSPYSEQERGWYMPIEDGSHDKTRLRTIRVTRLK